MKTAIEMLKRRIQSGLQNVIEKLKKKNAWQFQSQRARGRLCGTGTLETMFQDIISALGFFLFFVSVFW